MEKANKPIGKEQPIAGDTGIQTPRSDGSALSGAGAIQDDSGALARLVFPTETPPGVLSGRVQDIAVNHTADIARLENQLSGIAPDNWEQRGHMRLRLHDARERAGKSQPYRIVPIYERSKMVSPHDWKMWPVSNFDDLHQITVHELVRQAETGTPSHSDCIAATIYRRQRNEELRLREGRVTALSEVPIKNDAVARVLDGLDRRFDQLESRKNNVHATFEGEIAALDLLAAEYPHDEELQEKIAKRYQEYDAYRTKPKYEDRKGRKVYRLDSDEEVENALFALGIGSFGPLMDPKIPLEDVPMASSYGDGPHGRVIDLSRTIAQTTGVGPCIATAVYEPGRNAGGIRVPEGDAYLLHYSDASLMPAARQEMEEFIRTHGNTTGFLFGGEIIRYDIQSIRDREQYLEIVTSLGIPVTALFPEYTVHPMGWSLTLRNGSLWCGL